MTFSPATYEVPNWRDRALERSLEPARARSLAQLHQLVAAARDLANETGNAGFTVAQVAARAGCSLKAFYRSFAGKDDLLLALLEEDSRLGAELLRSVLAPHEDPRARIDAYVTGIFNFLTHPGAVGYAGVLVREHQRLWELRPEELRHALAPLVDLLTTELVAADRAGLVVLNDARRATDTVFGLVLSGIHEVTLGRAEPGASAQWLCRFCWSGLAGTPAAPATPAAPGSPGSPAAQAPQDVPQRTTQGGNR